MSAAVLVERGIGMVRMTLAIPEQGGDFTYHAAAKPPYLSNVMMHQQRQISMPTELTVLLSIVSK